MSDPHVDLPAKRLLTALAIALIVPSLTTLAFLAADRATFKAQMQNHEARLQAIEADRQRLNDSLHSLDIAVAKLNVHLGELAKQHDRTGER